MNLAGKCQSSLHFTQKERQSPLLDDGSAELNMKIFNCDYKRGRDNFKTNYCLLMRYVYNMGVKYKNGYEVLIIEIPGVPGHLLP